MTSSLPTSSSARQSAQAGAWAIAALAFGANIAWAAEGSQSGPSEVVFLAQLVLLMVVGRLLGEAMNRIGQPSVMGMLLGGILLGPSVLGALWPDLQHVLFPRTPEQKARIAMCEVITKCSTGLARSMFASGVARR